MNKIAYYAIPNPTDTAADAPALPRVIPNGVANTNDVIADIMKGITASEARCRIALEATIAVALEHVRRGETVDLGGFRLRPRIPGSMPCVDTPFDFGENTLVVDVLAEPELNEALAELVPFKVDANELASMIKVSNVTDVASMSIGEIHGTGEFIITGNSVTLDAEGESAKLADRKTGAELATAEVVSVSKGQRATCKLAGGDAEIAAGQYWLIVTTFGLIGETTPRVFRKPVTLVEPIPGPLATSPDGLSKVRTLNGKSDLAQLAPVPSSGAFELAGVGLSRYVGDAPTLVWGEDEDESVQLSDFTEGSAANSIRSTIGSSEVMLPTGVTTCRLMLGEGETALDLGPVKVERS